MTWQRVMDDPTDFTAFLTSQWPPVVAVNDPSGRARWAGNVTAAYEQLREGKG